MLGKHKSAYVQQSMKTRSRSEKDIDTAVNIVDDDSEADTDAPGK